MFNKCVSISGDLSLRAPIEFTAEVLNCVIALGDRGELRPFPSRHGNVIRISNFRSGAAFI